MAYQILEMTLVTIDGRSSTGPAGFVETKYDMAQFMHDYWAKVHTKKWMVLSAPLYSEYKDVLKKEAAAAGSDYVKAVVGLYTLNPFLFISGWRGSSGVGNSPLIRLSNISGRLVPMEYKDGKAGICVHCLGHYSL